MPALAAARAIPRPMPSDDAVMYATLPFRSWSGAGCETAGSGGGAGRAGGAAGVSAIRASSCIAVLVGIAAKYALWPCASSASDGGVTDVRLGLPRHGRRVRECRPIIIVRAPCPNEPGTSARYELESVAQGEYRARLQPTG